MLLITKVQFRKSENTSYIGIASIEIDNALIINDIKVYRKESDDSYNIVFPNDMLTKQHGKKNIVPLSSKVWKQINDAIKQAIEDTTNIDNQK